MKPFVIALLLFLSSVGAHADSYTYISAEQLKNSITAGKELLILDIQVKEDFAKHHLPGSTATYAYPVKTEAERAALDTVIAAQRETDRQVVIVCPRGKGGAKRSYDYMLSQNIPAEKITILEKGMAGWPYSELVEASK
jgi:rhodanese-related sulfurtransferase